MYSLYYIFLSTEEQILKLEQEIKNYEACIGELKVKLLQYKFMNSNDEGELHIITTTKEEEVSTCVLMHFDSVI